MLSPARRDTERALHLGEMDHCENMTLRKPFADTEAIR